MRRIISMMLVLVFIVSFSGCSKEENLDETTSQKVTYQIELPKKEKDSPPEDVISHDIEITLLEYNPNIISVTGVETIKSLTEENRFQIECSVQAETKYSDWEYQVSLVYSKYDQGWFLDDARILTTSSRLARIPSNEEMIQFVNADTYILEFWDEFLPIDNGYILNDTDFENGILTFCFTGKVPYIHAVMNTECTSLWKYNEVNETWELKRASENNGFVDRRVYFEMSADLSGHWEWEDEKVGNIDIIECSADQISVLWDGLSSPMVFKLSGSPLDKDQDIFAADPKDSGKSWYTSESGYTLHLDYEETHTYLCIYKSISSGYVDAAHVVAITQELPPIN